jgi:heptosyltransferase-1
MEQRGGERRFLCIMTTGLGDTLWSFPALESLRKSFPASSIVALASPLGGELLEHNPWTDRVCVWRHPVRLWRELIEERFDTVLVFHASLRALFPFGALLGAERLIGTAGQNKGLDRLLTAALPWTGGHEVERRLDIVEAAGGKRQATRLSFFLTPEERRWAKEALPREPFALLHPGAKDRYKVWPLARFAEVGKRLQAEGLHVVCSGAAGDGDLAPLIPGSIRLCVPVRRLAAALEAAAVAISCDTGPFHLAAAVGAPAIGLYAPTDPARCGPWQESRAEVIRKAPTCLPCIGRRCAEPFCLYQIGVDEVVKKSLDLIYRSTLRSRQGGPFERRVCSTPTGDKKTGSCLDRRSIERGDPRPID